LVRYFFSGTMGCLGLVVAMLAFSTACAYLFTQLLVLDWRDGAVPRIGTGLPRVRESPRTSAGKALERQASAGKALASAGNPQALASLLYLLYLLY
jgi:hypothetical protein